MKKTLLLLAMLLVSVASFAQWTAPVPSKVQEMATDGTTQFLYNKEAGGFFAGGNDWNTRASITANADSIKFVEADGDNFNFMCFPNAANKGKWLYVSCNSYDAMWVDAPNADSDNNYPGTDSWQVKKNANGTYSISNTLYDGKLGIAEIYRGLAGNTRTYINDPIDQYEENEEALPSVSGAFYDEWYFIDSVEYKALQPRVIQYLAAVNLAGGISAVKLQDPSYNTSVLDAVYGNTNSTKEELDSIRAICDAIVAFSKAYNAAQENYSALNYSEPLAVYKNINATKAELDAATNQIQEIINHYLSTEATFDTPIDYTKVIGDGSSVDPWTRDFTGEGTVGSHSTNTWSVEADNGADGTDMTTPFCEHWTGSGGILSDQKIYQTFKGAAPGLYKFSANVRAYSEAGGIDTFKGLTMYFGDEVIDIQEQAPMFKSGSKCVLWKDGGFSIIAVVKEAADIEFGFNIKDANFNWLAFKETSLLYYGNENAEENAAKLYKEDYEFEPYEDEAANPELISAYNAAVEKYDNAVAISDVKDAIKEAIEAKTALDANVKAYENLYDKIEAWSEAVGEKQGLAGDEWDAFCDFVQSEDEIEGYPTPTPTAILEGDYSLTTEEIEAYIAKVDELYATAVAHSLTPGTDCTDMLVNASFANGFTGWTTINQNVYTSNNGGMNNVEAFQSAVDCYQIVKDVPNGIYSLSCKAFERRGGDPNVYLYMNSFATPVQHINTDALPEALADNKVNCFIDNVGAWPSDNSITMEDGGVGYVPNSMEGASYAFAAGRYEQKVYGLIENGEMKIGITSNGVKIPDWVLWADFRLTYEGKTEEALTAILPTFIEELANYIEINEAEMTSPALAEANKALEQADEADDADAMYDALIAVNDALQASKDNVAAYKAYDMAFVDVATAADMSENEAAKEIFNQNIDKFGSYENLTTEELVALTEEMNLLTGKLNAPSTEGDWTSVIKNPAFDEANANGWNYAFSAISNIGYQQNQSYTNNAEGVTLNQFIEGWRSGNAALGDGSINQVISYLPEGAYTLGVDAIANLQSISDDTWQEKVTGVYLYAKQNGEVIAQQEIKTANGQPQHFTLDFIAAEGAVEIGIMTVSTTANWIAADNWSLECTSLDPSVAISTVNTTSTATPAGIYTISGARVANIQKGINIIKMTDGTVKKIMK